MTKSAKPPIEQSSNIDKAKQRFLQVQQGASNSGSISFDQYLERAIENPTSAIRNIFQVFHDLIEDYIEEGVDEYQDDPESINYAYYDTSRLFVEDSDNPFFADRLFSNRLVKLAENFRHGIQQNKIYIFKGPHGCGKSTFLDNLLSKFEQYANSPAGYTFEAVWRLDRELLGNFTEKETDRFLNKLSNLLDEYELRQSDLIEAQKVAYQGDMYIEVPCPSHDSPILMIPREYRRSFFDDLFKNDETKWKLFTEKQYEWVFRDTPCTICTQIYEALISRLEDPLKVLQMLYARHYRFNRRLGEGISVYNPGDRIIRQNVLGNEMLQSRINGLLRDSNQVQYLFSNFAKTNNGIYSLMDVKGHNVERLLELHNIISEGVHKVEYIEENVNSLFLALMNPEDEESIKDLPSLSDRIEYIKIPYILDLRTEVEIYRNTFGRHIDDRFLPRVLHNFARIIISTRLNQSSPAMMEWIGHPARYSRYCDDKLQLLKMEIYTGNIPEWLQQSDRKGLTARRRRRIIAESEHEGVTGFSGRDSIRIFSDLYSTYAKEGSMIDMATLYSFFRKHEDWMKLIPDGFLDSLLHMYNYTIMQEIKESLYYYNEEQIARDLKNYIFAVNFEKDTQVTCVYTGDRIKVGEDFYAPIEARLFNNDIDRERLMIFRKGIQKEYASRTLTQELRLEGKDMTETKLYQDLHERYVHHLKEKVLEPFLKNENFRRGIKDFGSEDFKTYDNRIRTDVTFLMDNLCEKFEYSKLGAKEVCIYLIDNELVQKFAKE
ncbi:serine protein kinase PrkA [Malonomonas rubra]|uniref:serine protein kinase PrkA n=1 Tax=Malonomonas rubra TaxID=57040 RepID=UPI0026F063AE|nr:serine protein kinase PrkA [Malonomonas rubra]